jgi:hypothetical protein
MKLLPSEGSIATALIALLLNHRLLVSARPVDSLASTSTTCDLEHLDFACSDFSRCAEPDDPIILWNCFDSVSGTRYYLNGDYNVFSSVVGRNPSRVTFENVLVTTITNSDPFAFNHGTITVLPHSTIQIIPRPEDRRRQLAALNGTNTLLIVRLTDAAGNVSSWNASETANQVFGTFGDTVTLKTVIEGCSNGQLMLQQYPTTANNSVVNGVVELTLAVNFSDYNAVYPANITLNEKDWTHLKDHVFLRLASLNQGFPNYASYSKYTRDLVLMFTNDNYELSGSPGQNIDGWASIGGGYSIYNGFSRLQTLVHEIGHNLLLGHSGENALSYGDK